MYLTAIVQDGCPSTFLKREQSVPTLSLSSSYPNPNYSGKALLRVLSLRTSCMRLFDVSGGTSRARSQSLLRQCRQCPREARKFFSGVQPYITPTTCTIVSSLFSLCRLRSDPECRRYCAPSSYYHGQWNIFSTPTEHFAIGLKLLPQATRRLYDHL